MAMEIQQQETCPGIQNTNLVYDYRYSKVGVNISHYSVMEESGVLQKLTSIPGYEKCCPNYVQEN
jgi:hypothetical protein